jgi:hypothetical protein
VENESVPDKLPTATAGTRGPTHYCGPETIEGAAGNCPATPSIVPPGSIPCYGVTTIVETL